MRALTWHGKHDVRVDTVPDPQIVNPRDAIIEVTATAICGFSAGAKPTNSARWRRCIGRLRGSTAALPRRLTTCAVPVLPAIR